MSKYNIMKNEDLELLIDNYDGALIAIDTKGLILALNETLSKIFCKPRNELIGKSAFLFLENIIAKSRLEILQQIVKTKKTIEWSDYERNRWWNTKAIPILDESGNVKKIIGVINDITEKKNAETAIRESEARLNDIINTMVDWTWEVDKNGEYIFVSNRIKDILGYEPIDIIGKTPFDLMPKDEAERVREIFKENVTKRKPIVDLENWNLSKKGKLVCLLTNGVPLMSKNGKLIGYRGVDKDVTEKKKAEQILRESEEKYRSIFTTSIGGILMTDKEGKITDVNPALLKILGYNDPKELIGKSAIGELQYPRKLDILINEQVSEKYVKNREITFKREDGSLVHCIGSLNYVRDDEGNILGTIGNFHDITEKVKADLEIRKSKEYLQRVIDSTSDLVISFDKNLNITTWNYTVERLTNLRKNRIIGKNPFNRGIFDEDDKLDSYLRNIFDGNNPQLDDIVLKSVRGEKHFIKINTNIMKNETDETVGILLMGKDISSEIKKFGEINPGNSYLVTDKDKSVLHNLIIVFIYQKKAVLMISRGSPIENGDFIDYFDIKNLEDLILKIEKFLINKKETVVLLDRVDYLIAKYSFGEFIKTIYKVNDIIEKHKSNFIMRINPDYIEKNQYIFLREEFKTFPIRILDDIILDENLFSILRYIYERNRLNETVTYTKIYRKFSISRVTNSKRIEELKKMGLVYVRKVGKSKHITITDKGKNLIEKKPG